MLPWMKKSIEKSEARIEAVVDRKIQAVHWRIYSFELRVMERPQPRPTVDLNTFQAELAKLRTDVNALTVVEEAIPEPTPERMRDELEKGETEFEVAQQQSILDEELRQQRVIELVVGASGSRSTTDYVPTTVKGVTDGVSLADPASSRQPDPPTS
uniref:Integrase core domain containing protein n=1 Tax=Solanum tuberosum TaxID=4113 RepID=M1DAV5_SOLTU